jgi:hypothetical protein
MKLLMWVVTASLGLSLLSLWVGFFLRRRFLGYTTIGFFYLAITLATLDAWKRHLHLISALFALFAAALLYKLLTRRSTAALS